MPEHDKKGHRTIMETEIASKKIYCYLGDSAAGAFLLKILKYFEVMLNTFEFPNAKKKKKKLRTLTPLLVYACKFS